jgi:hypothetical protein
MNDIERCNLRQEAGGIKAISWPRASGTEKLQISPHRTEGLQGAGAAPT